MDPSIKIRRINSKNSVYRKMFEFLYGSEVGKTFVISDFKHFGPNAGVRSALVDLIEDGVLERLAQGVYVRAGNNIHVDDSIIAQEVARRNGKTATIVSDQIVDGQRTITILSNGSNRKLILPSGTIVRFKNNN